MGTEGEALLEAYKPQPYTELVGGKTMAQVRTAGGGRCGKFVGSGNGDGGEGTHYSRCRTKDPFVLGWVDGLRQAGLVLQAGCLPILHMRGFQKGGKLPDDLEKDIITRHAA